MTAASVENKEKHSCSSSIVGTGLSSSSSITCSDRLLEHILSENGEKPPSLNGQVLRMCTGTRIHNRASNKDHVDAVVGPIERATSSSLLLEKRILVPVERNGQLLCTIRIFR